MRKQLSFFFISVLSSIIGYGQGKYTGITLPRAISDINQEFSGMALYKNRLYLEPQYGNHMDTKLDGDFVLYSLNADSISSVIAGKDAALTSYRTIRVLNLNQLPDSVKKDYEGFEAIAIVNNRVYLSIETHDTNPNCFLLKGLLDTVNNEVRVDAKHFAVLKRPLYIKNAGFESVTYLPKENKLLAYYEFNAAPNGGNGFLIDTAFQKLPQPIKAPFVYFRITDIAATKTDKIYGINYYYSGDYDAYLNNSVLSNREGDIKKNIPYLRDSLDKDAGFLKNKLKTFARIVSLNSYKDKRWKQVATFDGFKNNWEGLVLFRGGALIITDANRSPKQLTTFGYIAF